MRSSFVVLTPIGTRKIVVSVTSTTCIRPARLSDARHVFLRCSDRVWSWRAERNTPTFTKILPVHAGQTPMTLLGELEGFARDHRSHGGMSGDATEPTANGLYLFGEQQPKTPNYT